jgi:hypothetical protein
MTGGGALLTDFDVVLRKATGLPVFILARWLHSYTSDYPRYCKQKLDGLVEANALSSLRVTGACQVCCSTLISLSIK